MAVSDHMPPEIKQRIVKEHVPGNEISLANILENPDYFMYTQLGLDPAGDYSK